MQKFDVGNLGSLGLSNLLGLTLILTFASAFFESGLYVFSDGVLGHAARLSSRCVTPTDGECLSVALEGKNIPWDWFAYKNTSEEGKFVLRKFHYEAEVEKVDYELSVQGKLVNVVHPELEIPQYLIPTRNYQVHRNQYVKKFHLVEAHWEGNRVLPKGGFEALSFKENRVSNFPGGEKYIHKSKAYSNNFPGFELSHEISTVNATPETWKAINGGSENFLKASSDVRELSVGQSEVLKSTSRLQIDNAPIAEDLICQEGHKCGVVGLGDSEKDWREYARVALKVLIKSDGSGEFSVDSNGLRIDIYDRSGNLLEQKLLGGRSKDSADCQGKSCWYGLWLRGPEDSTGGKNSNYANIRVPRGGWIEPSIEVNYESGIKKKINLRAEFLYYYDEYILSFHRGQEQKWMQVFKGKEEQDVQKCCTVWAEQSEADLSHCLAAGRSFFTKCSVPSSESENPETHWRFENACTGSEDELFALEGVDKVVLKVLDVPYCEKDRLENLNWNIPQAIKQSLRTKNQVGLPLMDDAILCPQNGKLWKDVGEGKKLRAIGLDMLCPLAEKPPPLRYICKGKKSLNSELDSPAQCDNIVEIKSKLEKILSETSAALKKVVDSTGTHSFPWNPGVGLSDLYYNVQFLNGLQIKRVKYVTKMESSFLTETEKMQSRDFTLLARAENELRRKENYYPHWSKFKIIRSSETVDKEILLDILKYEKPLIVGGVSKEKIKSVWPFSEESVPELPMYGNARQFVGELPVDFDLDCNADDYCKEGAVEFKSLEDALRWYAAKVYPELYEGDGVESVLFSYKAELRYPFYRVTAENKGDFNKCSPFRIVNCEKKMMDRIYLGREIEEPLSCKKYRNCTKQLPDNYREIDNAFALKDAKKIEFLAEAKGQSELARWLPWSRQNCKKNEAGCAWVEVDLESRYPYALTRVYYNYPLLPSSSMVMGKSYVQLFHEKEEMMQLGILSNN